MKHQKLETIRFGKWFFDHNEFKLLHRDSLPYYVDVNELKTEAEAIEWLRHLAGRLSQRDVEDYVRIVKVLLCLDKSKFRSMTRRSRTALDKAAERIVMDRIYENRVNARMERQAEEERC
jgi:hypothetical protein